jgi:hypothetical protein
MENSISERPLHDTRKLRWLHTPTRMTTEEGWDYMKGVHGMKTPATIAQVMKDHFNEWDFDVTLLGPFNSFTGGCTSSRKYSYLRFPGEVESFPTALTL